MSREFYMGDSFNREYDDWKLDNWKVMCLSDSPALKITANSGGTSGISKRLDNIESSLEKVCNGCVNFAANAEEAGKAIKKITESLNKLRAGVGLRRIDLKTLGGNGRYVQL